jgi:hypothetical protein
MLRIITALCTISRAGSILQVPLEVLESLSSNKRVYNLILQNYPSLLMCRSLSDNGKLNSIPESSVLPARVPVTAIKATRHASDDQVDTPLLEKHCPEDHKAIAIISRSPRSSIRKHDRHDSTHPASIKKQICSATQSSPHYLKNIRVHR